MTFKVPSCPDGLCSENIRTNALRLTPLLSGLVEKCSKDAISMSAFKLKCRIREKTIKGTVQLIVYAQSLRYSSRKRLSIASASYVVIRPLHCSGRGRQAPVTSFSSRYPSFQGKKPRGKLLEFIMKADDMTASISIHA